MQLEHCVPNTLGGFSSCQFIINDNNTVTSHRASSSISTQASAIRRFYYRNSAWARLSACQLLLNRRDCLHSPSGYIVAEVIGYVTDAIPIASNSSAAFRPIIWDYTKSKIYSPFNIVQRSVHPDLSDRLKIIALILPGLPMMESISPVLQMYSSFRTAGPPISTYQTAATFYEVDRNRNRIE